MVKVSRFGGNPLFSPSTLPPSQPNLKVEGVLNPGAFRYHGRVGLVMRVAERPLCADDEVATLLLDDGSDVPRRWVIRKNDPAFRQVDPRGFWYDDVIYLTTMSHLLVVWSDDGGEHFSLDGCRRIFPSGVSEGFGIEDCRVTEIDGVDHLTYTAVGRGGITVGYMNTCDWEHFSDRQVWLPPTNKDCTLFPRRIHGRYYLLHRPSTCCDIGGNNIWMASSEDLRGWHDHRLVAMPRPGEWDGARIGGGASPIETPDGWLEIYHGATAKHRYCFGAMLFDLDDPYKLIARSVEPIMEPELEYELHGFMSDCVFTNGHILDGDRLRLYYGAADKVVCGADLSLSEVLATLTGDRGHRTAVRPEKTAKVAAACLA